MPRRKPARMARVQSRGRTSSARSSSRSQSTTSQTVGSFLGQIGSAFIQWLLGPVGQQVFALALISFGLLTVFTIAGLNSGVIVNAWSRLLVLVFGWGSYSVAALLIALGLLRLRHLTHQPTAWRLRPLLGFELTLLGLLTLTYGFMTQRGWGAVESGRAGGLVGWAMHFFLYEAVGPLNTVLLMVILVFLGLFLAFDFTTRDLSQFGGRLNQVRVALRDRWAARSEPALEAKDWQESDALRREPESGEQRLSPGVILSPIPPRQPVTAPVQKSSAVRTERRSTESTAPMARKAKGAPPATSAPLDLLVDVPSLGVDQDELDLKSRIIEETLAQFGVPARVTEVRLGPTVTQFGVTPGYISRGIEDEHQRKVRVSQISALKDDLALALAARTVRVEAPVPGRAVVGIEVPNAEVNLVSLRSVLGSEAFRKCGKPLCFAVGLDVAGAPRVADLAAMPHLLVAGTTGSGKSVFVKALAASLVMHNPPAALRIVAIDPKMVELSRLNGLPHLLGRTETDLERIIRVLRWVAHEMDRRYKLLAASEARNLDDYNARLGRRRRSASEGDEDSELLPRIVVLIDELADLMMSAPEETERTLTRIAQMARATGIHLVVATQRPSTDVVTGLIKANFPARVSFATASAVDSRVIIDALGAESLLGHGDMLFLPPDISAPLRIQGCHISDQELEAIIGFWQQEAGATPAQAPWDVLTEAKGPDTLRLEGQSEDADLLERAIALAQSRGQISASGLQRRLRISYPRAARLMEEMEQMGIVGPQESAGRKRRVILGGEEDT